MITDSESSTEDDDETDDLIHSSMESPIPFPISQVAPSPSNDYLEIENNVSTHHVTYKIVGDNLDKNVYSRYMRVKKYRTKSHNMFHSFAVADRIDTNAFVDDHQLLCLPSPDMPAKSFLPSLEDDVMLKKNIVTLISRILIQHIPFFKLCFDDLVPSHIAHEYTKEMSRKSDVVGK